MYLCKNNVKTPKLADPYKKNEWKLPCELMKKKTFRKIGVIQTTLILNPSQTNLEFLSKICNSRAIKMMIRLYRRPILSTLDRIFDSAGTNKFCTFPKSFTTFSKILQKRSRINQKLSVRRERCLYISFTLWWSC